MNFLFLMIVIELLIINTFTTYSCAKKEDTKFLAFLFVCLLTAALSVLLYFVLSKMPNDGEINGKGLFMLSGFLYIIPLKYLLGQPIKHMIIIMSSSWIYTMFVFSLSFRVAQLFPSDNMILSAAIVQTFIFAVSLPFYIKFLNHTFIYILRNIENRMINYLLTISLSWFFIIFLLNYMFVEGSTIIMEFVMLIVIILTAILSYKFVFYLVSVNNKAKQLSQITKIDTLTQLKNREGLYEDAMQRIENKLPFSIIFMDLDSFKLINDCFGHAVGDAYLIEFARTAKEVLKINDGFYRLHGDEFVIMDDRADVDIFCDEIKKLEFLNDPDGVAFRGISLGVTSYPVDGNTINDLLYLADLKMYQVKKEKHMTEWPLDLDKKQADFS